VVGFNSLGKNKIWLSWYLEVLTYWYLHPIIIEKQMLYLHSNNFKKNVLILWYNTLYNSKSGDQGENSIYRGFRFIEYLEIKIIRIKERRKIVLHNYTYCSYYPYLLFII